MIQAHVLEDSFADIESVISRLCQMPQIEDEDRDRIVSALFIIVYVRQCLPKIMLKDLGNELVS